VEDFYHSYTSEFYARATLDVAQDLLGAVLCRRFDDGSLVSGRIVEVEAYTADDPACHAFRGYTPRSSKLFGPPGLAYVYFIYGMYHCLNVVTEPDGIAGAVLIRAVEAANTNGPGKLCRQWQIDLSHNGISLMQPGSTLWICPGKQLKPSQIGRSSRVGLSVATDRQWRFFAKKF
jgi:DNA-3-methyladenine glycosylase